MKKNHIFTLTLPLLVFIIFSFSIKKVIAQIIPDQTLPNNSQVLPGCTVCEINGGTIKNQNLFHSFQEFSVPTNGEAYFNNNSSINNIITRVTGNSISNIDGIIKNNNSANLFFINPHGIVFGEKAIVDIGGSFIASTANSIKFADSQFSSKVSSETPLLSITTPIGLQMGTNPGVIQVKSKTGLQIKPNQTLGLVGGNINLEGATLITNGGRLELGSVNQESLVKITPIQQGFLLGYNEIKNFGDIQLSEKTSIDININKNSIFGGEIKIQTGNLRMIENSRIASFNLSPIVAGSISVNASDTVEIIGNGEFEKAFGEVINPTANPADRRNGFFAINLGSGNSGNFKMNTDKFILKDGAFLLISTFGEGNGGDININSTKSVEVSNSLFATGNRFGSTGNAGNISLNTGNLILNNRGIISSSSLGIGKAGNINIHATNSIDMTGGKTFTEVILGGGINTNITSSTFGNSNSGNIEIHTQNLTLRNQAEIIANTFGIGDAGDVNIYASAIELFGPTEKNPRTIPTALGSSSNFNSQGNGGNLMINTNSLLLKDGSQISTETVGRGKAGNITINAHDIQLIDSDKSIFPNALYANSTNLDLDLVGDGGNIIITTNSLLLKNGSQINTDTSSNGKAGNITINADNIKLIGIGKNIFSSGFFAGSKVTATGKAGDIIINTNNLEVKDRARISVEALGKGNSGNIDINSRSISLENLALISANTRSPNNNLNEEQASITLHSESLIMRHGSKITTNAIGNNVNGGNIYINTGVLAALENSDISANSTDFRGGRVTVNTKRIFGTEFRFQLTEESDITATGAIPEFNGIVQLNITEIDPTKGLFSLNDDLVNTESLLSNNICASDKIVSSSFMITGKGGLPAKSEDLISNSPGLLEWVNSSEGRDKKVVVLHKKDKLDEKYRVIQQAQGWIIGFDGRIILTAETPKIIVENSGLNHPSCRVNYIQ